MRFVAGRCAVAEVLLAGAPWRRCCWPGRRGGCAAGRSASTNGKSTGSNGRGAVAKKLATPWRRAIGKKLQTDLRFVRLRMPV